MNTRGRKKGYVMSEEQKQAISKGMLNYYNTMSVEQKTRRDKANNKIREFWKIYKEEKEKYYQKAEENYILMMANRIIEERQNNKD